MSKMHQGFDLSRFKKVASDKSTTTLRHANGHEIKLAHGGLTPKMKAELDVLPMHLAEGGDPEAGAPAPDMDTSSPAEAEDAPEDTTEEEPSQEPSEDKIDVVGQRHPQTAAQMTADDMAWDNDLKNGHIKPETYQQLFENKNTLGKIGTIFGLIAGGGQGPAMQMMTQEIQNDLHAQIQSKTNENNFYNTYTNMIKGQADADYIASQTALNKLPFAATQSLQDQVDQLPPGPYHQNFQGMLDQVRQALHIQGAQRNQQTEQILGQRAYQRIQGGQHDDQSKWTGPVNMGGVSDAKLIAPTFKINPDGLDYGAKHIAMNRQAWKIYNEGFKELEKSAGSGQAGSLVGAGSGIAGTVGGTLLTGNPLIGAIAGGAASAVGNSAEKINQKRAAIVTKISRTSGLSPAEVESIVPSIFDLGSQDTKNQKMRAAAEMFDNKELPESFALKQMEHWTGKPLFTPAPYLGDAQAYAAGKSRGSKAERTASKGKKISDSEFKNSMAIP